MFPQEIQIPTSATIIEPDYSRYTKLTHQQIIRIINTPKLQQILEKRAIIIINDHHRSTPSYRILLAIKEIIHKESLNPKIEKIVIATGSHQAPDEDEKQKLTRGIEKELKLEIVVHNDKTSEFTNYGTTSRGTPIKLNSILSEYQQIITINSVEPHYFAGFTGGVKSIVPGLAARKTIEANHSWALDPKSRPTELENNPLQLDLWEALSLVEANIIGIQMVNFQDDIFHVSVDHLRQAFDDAVKVSMDLYTYTIPKKVDVILSIIYPPLDRSLYQAQKGIENTRQGLREGGELILLAKCNEGIGNQQFYETIAQYDNPTAVLNSLTQETYNFGDHKAFNFASLANSCTLTIVSSLSITETNNIFANHLPIKQLENYLEDLSSQGKEILIVVDSGSYTLLAL